MAGFVAPSLMELNAKNVKDVVLDKIRAVKELDRAIAFSSVSEGGGPVSAVKCDKHVNHYAHLLWLRVLQVIRVIRVLGPGLSLFLLFQRNVLDCQPLVRHFLGPAACGC
jgi:hypothetical protein